MARFFGRLLLVLLLVFPSTVLFTANDSPSFMVTAQDASEDSVDGEDNEDTVVETDDPAAAAGADAGTVTATQDEEESDDKPLKPSPDADTKLIFTKPAITGKIEFPAGVIVRVLVGFTNNGQKDFIIDNMEASFRYPQDFSFYIQNFTTARFDQTVSPKREATFSYAFIPSEQLTARPFGLSINLNYKDVDGNLYQDALFNDTISIIELDEGLDGETFFLYVFLAAVGVLLLVGAQQVLATFSKKRLSRPKRKVEMGTQNDSGIDYSWLPKETLSGMNKSPKRSPKQSPHQRRTKRRTAGGGDE
ncbi:translocon-associated protein subunit alpha-like [Tubulanus polymorphus]|uniref:translocon-associated protein subunit alpha-like n=1 Tax=Tubulanus polymorphus TaxID=672921 RepID=UPI003DA42082